MDALILTCGTGGGHNAACRAVYEGLEARGHKATILNPYTLKSQKTADAVDNAYIKLVQKVPHAFGAIYKLGNVYRKLPVKSPVYHINQMMCSLMEQYLEENAYDVILMTHLFPAEILTAVKRRGFHLPKTIFISTDYTCIPFTEETDCDHYIIPSEELTSEYCEKGIPEERIRPFGIPVSPAFYGHVDKSEAKRSLGLKEDVKYILIAGGSMGAGRIEDTISLILSSYEGRSDNNTELIVICGNNEALHKKLVKKYADKCTVITHTDRMADYLRACDIYISKPGGLSTTEAAVSNIPLILMSPISGCEIHNMRFFGSHGMSVSISSAEDELLDACRRLEDDAFRKNMINMQIGTLPPNATENICAFAESLCGIGTTL